MAKINGIEGMSPDQVAFEINRGAKFVRYRYCVSALVVTIMQSTDIYLIKAGENRILKGLPWTLLTLVMGWRGIPWGPIRSIQSLWINFSGGGFLSRLDSTVAVVSDVVRCQTIGSSGW